MKWTEKKCFNAPIYVSIHWRGVSFHVNFLTQCKFYGKFKFRTSHLEYSWSRHFKWLWVMAAASTGKQFLFSPKQLQSQARVTNMVPIFVSQIHAPYGNVEVGGRRYSHTSVFVWNISPHDSLSTFLKEVKLNFSFTVQLLEQGSLEQVRSTVYCKCRHLSTLY